MSSKWSSTNPFVVKTLSGQSIVVDPDETIAEVKQRVRDKEGIPADQQRLIFHGIEIQEHKPQLTIKEIIKQQDIIIQEQDLALDDLAKSVARIRQISLTMNNEITEQNKILVDFNKDVDKTTDNLKETNKKIQKLHKEIKKPCIIM